MRIGKEYWRCVSTDTAGVPTGGRYGDVKWFEQELNRHGLKLAWSQIHHCFGIYLERGPGRVVWQRLCLRDDTQQPIPLNSHFLWLMLHLWERHCRMTTATINATLTQLRRDEKSQIAKERYENAQMLEKDVMDSVWLDRGYRTPKAFSIPKKPKLCLGQ